MKLHLLPIAPLLLLAACSGLTSDAAPEGGGGGGGSVQFTDYTDQTEIFAEHRALVVGRARRFDAHMSWLPSYRAITSGSLTVELVYPDGRIDRGQGEVSDTPGIFRVLVTASRQGTPRLRFTMAADGRTSVHDLGPVTVYPTREAAEAANPDPGPNPNRIAFSKEVQWRIPFGTTAVVSRALPEVVPVLVDVRFAPDAEAVIAAPVAGIVRMGGAVPAAGTPVRAGQTLATISAQLGEGQDLASLDFDISRARIAVEAASRDTARLQRLHAQEAVPLRRVQDAQSALRIAQAELGAASRRRGALAGGGAGVPVLSPISGIVVSSTLVRGSSVQAGTEMIRVGNPGNLWLVARVPEAMAARVATPNGLDVDMPDGALQFTNGRGARLVQAGSFVDPRTRTMEVIFATGGNGLRPGSRLNGRLLSGSAAVGLAIPAGAVINEGGQTVVYVQVAGETFERRPVAVGRRSGELVAVTGDVRAGERVVTTGAAAVRAAAATPDAFGHGHAH
jgi:membrane fusion protein, heavy metal efflux system